MTHSGIAAIICCAYGNAVWVAGGDTGQLRTENPAERQMRLKAIGSNAYMAGSEATVILKKETFSA